MEWGSARRAGSGFKKLMRGRGTGWSAAWVHGQRGAAFEDSAAVSPSLLGPAMRFLGAGSWEDSTVFGVSVSFTEKHEAVTKGGASRTRQRSATQEGEQP